MRPPRIIFNQHLRLGSPLFDIQGNKEHWIKVFQENLTPVIDGSPDLLAKYPYLLSDILDTFCQIL